MPPRKQTISPHSHGPSEIWERPHLVASIEREKRLLAARIRALRHERKLTIAQAAEAIGIHENALGRMELGKAALTFPTLVAIAKAYRVRMRELFE